MNRGSPGEITEYWVAEEGNQSHSKFIYPSSFCYFDAYSGTDGYEISGFDGPPNYMEATRFPGPANGTFAMYCPAADSNDAIDVYIGPGTASNTTVVNESGSTVFTVNQCSSPCGFPLQLKSGILDWNTWSDSFEILSAGDGDARFTSYRTFEEIP
jgi:hypothetical protein